MRTNQHQNIGIWQHLPVTHEIFILKCRQNGLCVYASMCTCLCSLCMHDLVCVCMCMAKYKHIIYISDKSNFRISWSNAFLYWVIISKKYVTVIIRHIILWHFMVINTLCPCLVYYSLETKQIEIQNMRFKNVWSFSFAI